MSDQVWLEPQIPIPPVPQTLLGPLGLVHKVLVSLVADKLSALTPLRNLSINDPVLYSSSVDSDQSRFGEVFGPPLVSPGSERPQSTSQTQDQRGSSVLLPEAMYVLSQPPPYNLLSLCLWRVRMLSLRTPKKSPAAALSPQW